jgi:hypothetical protein
LILFRNTFHHNPRQAIQGIRNQLSNKLSEQISEQNGLFAPRVMVGVIGGHCARQELTPEWSQDHDYT